MSSVKPGSQFDDDATDDGRIERVQEQVKAGIKKIVPGSPAAKDWDWFCRVYTGIIRRMAEACHLRPDETEVLENEVWQHVMRSLPRYRPDGKPRSFRRWLNTIVRRRAVDLLRQKKRHPTESLTARLTDDGPFDPGPEPADAFDQCWVSQQVMSLLDIFRATDPEHTRMFEEHYLDGKSMAQLATERHCTPAQAATHVHGIRVRLRKAMNYFVGHESK